MNRESVTRQNTDSFREQKCGGFLLLNFYSNKILIPFTMMNQVLNIINTLHIPLQKYNKVVVRIIFKE